MSTGATAAASSDDRAAAHVAAAVAVAVTAGKDGTNDDGHESLTVRIARLKDEQAAMRASKKTLAKDLRNATRRASRLKKRARQLTDNDLVEVLKMREVKQPVVPVPVAVSPVGSDLDAAALAPSVDA